LINLHHKQRMCRACITPAFLFKCCHCLLDIQISIWRN